MKIMVICAGVIGSHLRHYLQYKRTVDYVQDAVGTSGGKRLLQKCSGA